MDKYRGMLAWLVLVLKSIRFFFFFFNDTATTEIYTLSLHDALPICRVEESCQINRQIVYSVKRGDNCKENLPHAQ